VNVVAMTLRAVQIARSKGLRVTFEPGWETRGNGYTGRYVGVSVHHTGTPSSVSNPFPTRRLLREGRDDLSGPLCNSAGPADGSIHVMAAHAANHAGASGGRSMGPLPVTRLFNPLVWGHEIDYAGSVPMLTAQYRAAVLWSIAVLQALREHGQISSADPQRIRAHAETSITGKWDPGDAPGRTINMTAFRAATRVLQEDDMSAAAEAHIAELYKMLVLGTKDDGRYNRDLGHIKDTLSKQIAAVQGAISAQEARILAAVAADGTHPVDVHELANALLTQLGTDLGQALLDALIAELHANRNPEGN
jgi:hypothetical protein